MYYVRWNWQFSSCSTNQQILYLPWAITAIVILDHVNWQKPSEHLEFAVWPLPVLQDRLHWVFLCILCCIKSGFFPCLCKIQKSTLQCCFGILEHKRLSSNAVWMTDSQSMWYVQILAAFWNTNSNLLVIQLQETPHYCPFRWACTMFGIVSTILMHIHCVSL